MKSGKSKGWNVELLSHVHLFIWVIFAKDGIVLSDEVFSKEFKVDMVNFIFSPKIANISEEVMSKRYFLITRSEEYRRIIRIHDRIGEVAHLHSSEGWFSPL